MIKVCSYFVSNISLERDPVSRLVFAQFTSACCGLVLAVLIQMYNERFVYDGEVQAKESNERLSYLQDMLTESY